MTLGDRAPASTLVLYQTEDGRTCVQCRFEDETRWLTQARMAELFQVTVANINVHLKAIFAEAELPAGSTIKPYLIVRNAGGSRRFFRELVHDTLPATLAGGYRALGNSIPSGSLPAWRTSGPRIGGRRM